MSLHALVEKWRAEAVRRSFMSGSQIFEACADELESALADGGEAVAWVVVDTAMPLNKDDGSAFLGNYWVRFETNSADRANRAVRSFANGNPDGRYKLVPLFTHPAGAVQENEGRQLAIYRKFVNDLDDAVEYSHAVITRAELHKMLAAITAALNPGGSRE